MYLVPDTEQTRAAWSRVAAGLEAMVWVPMEVQPPEGYAPEAWAVTGDRVFGSPKPVDSLRELVDRKLFFTTCPVRPGNRVGWREEWWVTDCWFSTGATYSVQFEFRDGQRKRYLSSYAMDVNVAWQPPATQPAWSIRRWAEVAAVDVGRPLYMSLDDWRKSLNVDGRTEEKARATFVGEKFQKDHIREAFGDDAGLWWWKVRTNQMEKRA